MRSQNLMLSTSATAADLEKSADFDTQYRPFILDEQTRSTDWISALELETVTEMARRDLLTTSRPLRVLVLYGSLRKRSYSKLMAFEAARILHRLGCDVRVFNPAQLPVKNDLDENHESTGVFKNQIDWIPLSAGSVRPTQGRTLSIIQVNGGSQSFNAVNSLRILGRWMRMFCIPNQSSLPKAYTQFTDEGDDTSRLLPSGNRDRLVDCMEEFVKYTILMRPHFELFGDRYSERIERRAKVAKAVGKVDNGEAKEVDSRVTAGVDQSKQSDMTGQVGTAGNLVNGVNIAGI